jgi:adenylate cyclase
MPFKGLHSFKFYRRKLHGAEGCQAVVGELKNVTLLTIDIRGFSRMSKQMGPQQSVLVLNRFFAATGEIVFRHQGMVDKYLGDGFLAVFGVSAAKEDAAANAVQTALKMRRCLVGLNRGLGRDFGISIQVGISVHTGDVVVGNIGFKKKMDYTVIGEPVNIVFRMQNLVKVFPNGILVSGSTLEKVRSRSGIHAASVHQHIRHDLGELAVYALLEPERDLQATAATTADTSARHSSSSNIQRKPSTKSSASILSP